MGWKEGGRREDELSLRVGGSGGESRLGWRHGGGGRDGRLDWRIKCWYDNRRWVGKKEEEKVRVGWIGNLEKEVICCDEKMEEVEVSGELDLEEGEVLINWTNGCVEEEVMVWWIEN